MNLEDLLGSLAGAPHLPGARCVGQPEVDETDDPDITDACKYVCFRCPARIPCAAWAKAQPKGSLSGCISGRIYRNRHHRRTRDTGDAA